MEFNKKKEGRFIYEGFENLCVTLLKIKGTIQGKVVNIAIYLGNKMNHINVDVANQIMIPKPSIIKKKGIICKEYKIKDS